MATTHQGLQRIMEVASVAVFYFPGVEIGKAEEEGQGEEELGRKERFREKQQFLRVCPTSRPR